MIAQYKQSDWFCIYSYLNHTVFSCHSRFALFACFLFQKPTKSAKRTKFCEHSKITCIKNDFLHNLLVQIQKVKATRTAGSDAENLFKRQESRLVECGSVFTLIDWVKSSVL